MYINSNILPYFLCDYVIMIDDDQRFYNNWIGDIWKLREPKTYKGWYCKYWNDNLNYNNGSNYKYKDLKNNINTGIKAHYVGTGASIVDINIFRSDSLLYSIPNDLPEHITVLNIEDLWLSYICNLYNYKKSRTLLAPIIFKSDNVALSLNLKSHKQILFDYLVKYNLLDDENTKEISNTVNILEIYKNTYINNINNINQDTEDLYIDSDYTNKSSKIIRNNNIKKKIYYRYGVFKIF